MQIGLFEGLFSLVLGLTGFLAPDNGGTEGGVAPSTADEGMLRSSR